MKTLSVSNSKHTYPICIGSGILSQIQTLIPMQSYSSVCIITDEMVKSLYLQDLLHNISIPHTTIVLPIGEKEKNIINLQKIWTHMADSHCDRQTLVINLGGGVIGDIGGFGASTYMRGVDFLNIPTTLLSQVDESIGGKTGIDFHSVKNLVGTFQSPIGVLIDTNTLNTLADSEFNSGFSEIIKTALIKDASFFDRISQKNLRDFTDSQLEDIIAASCTIKADIVENDEAEQNTRKLLNFGHTIGHAVEALSLETHKPLLHGQAVAIGMIAESMLSHKMSLLTDQELQRITDTITHANLPKTIKNISAQSVLQKMQSDKKNNRGVIRFTLLKGIGNGIINQTVPVETILYALGQILV